MIGSSFTEPSLGQLEGSENKNKSLHRGRVAILLIRLNPPWFNQTESIRDSKWEPESWWGKSCTWPLLSSAQQDYGKKSCCFLAIISTAFRLSPWKTDISAALWRKKSKKIGLPSHFPSLWNVGLSGRRVSVSRTCSFGFAGIWDCWKSSDFGDPW